MSESEGLIGGFLVLGFAIFIAGFLTGMLAFSVLSLSADATTVGLMFFVLGFVWGAAIILALVALRRRKLRTSSET